MIEMNYDCFRDVLQFIVDNIKVVIDEETNSMRHSVISLNTIQNNDQLNQNYSPETIYYTIEKLLEAEYIKPDIIKHRQNEIYFLTIRDVSVTGFEFLKLANDNNTWNKMKIKFKQFGGFSLDVLKLLIPELIEDYTLH